MLGALALTAALAVPGVGGCPKPIVHHRKHAPVAECSCVDEPPRTIMLTPPEEIAPIEVGVYRYYQILTFDIEDSVGGAGFSWQPDPPDYFTPARGVVTPPSVRAPEIDPSSGVTAITMLALFILIIKDRRPPNA